MTSQDRRAFLLTLGGSVLGLSGCARALAASTATGARRHLSPIGIQIYPVRREAQRDLPGTIHQLARIGYKEIEFWGAFPHQPAEIRRMLDDNGMMSPSIHIGFPDSPETLGRVFDRAKIIGQEYITVTSLPPGPTATADDWVALARRLDETVARVRDAGFRLAFHNYPENFKPIGGVVPYEVLLRESNPTLVNFELDVHWAYAGGADPIDLLHRFPNRFAMVHVKDSSGPPAFAQTDVGAGSYNWKRIFDATTAAGVKHYFAEIDESPDPLAFARTSYDYLTHLEF